ncbi:GNAT family N-acetyltransferase [Pedobacter alpinus]|uniref:GNAT family N-acetyltransferase n=1 Tax=Pedobacter alpinus TaxID=1590643 RepID=A0ABW5TT91_9SPHI
MGVKVFLNDDIYIDKGYSINTDKTLLDLNYIYNFLTTESYWAKNLPYLTFQTSIEFATCFGVYHQNKQVGFARVISDYSTFAYLADVFIDFNYRKQGLSKWLMQTIINYPDFKNLRRFLLATADAQTLYQKFGFESLVKPERFMEILNPYPLKNISE